MRSHSRQRSTAPSRTSRGLSMQQVQLLALGLIIVGCGAMTLRGLSLSSAADPQRPATPVQLLGGRIRRVTMTEAPNAPEQVKKQLREDEDGRPEPLHDVGQEEPLPDEEEAKGLTRPPTASSHPPATNPPTIAWHRATAKTSSPTPLPSPAARGSRAPPPLPLSGSRPLSSSACFRERDLGLIDALQSSVRTFCHHRNDEDNSSSNSSSRSSVTQVSILQAAGGLRASLWRDVVLDLSRARVQSPISSLAQDGGGHDPRFRLDSVQLYCACDELAAFAATQPRALRLWDPTLAYPPSKASDSEPAMTLCTGNTTTQRPQELLSNRSNVLVLREKTLLMARRDDHNPFFQVSSALNAWILLRALQWRPSDVRVVQLDGGYASPTDALAQRLLSPRFPMLGASDVAGKRLHLAGDVLLPPFESSGPMMQHLNDHEPCQQSELFTEFRREALAALELDVNASSDAAAAVVTVTVISRRHYGGRVVHRRWRNEHEILDQMRLQYANASPAIVFQSVDFVALPLASQMQLMLESDVVIGMHGAGLVNVLWTRPGTLVVEIFPRRRRRWGFRNLCQFVGCEWHEFRGGEDLTVGGLRDDNAYDKRIDYDDWARAFDPLFERVLARRNVTLPQPRGYS